ncbi:hypothetical protein Tco_1093823 [Tanacetum coccineum]|uniref:Uncharacterized protein n=1 Tax=Tanacetum coccineum TaxID=301880 RepID=A0ABQ5IEB4_9ASTR
MNSAQFFERVIARTEGWKGQFFFVQSSIIPAKYPQLLLEQNKWDSKSYKDKPPLILRKIPCSNKWLLITSFMENEEDLSFLPKEPSPGFGTGSPSILVNMESLSVDVEPILKLVEDTADSGDSPKPETIERGPSGLYEEKACTWGLRSSLLLSYSLKASSSKDDTPFLAVSDDDEGLPDVFELKDAMQSLQHSFPLSFFATLPDVFKLKDANACHLKISAITPPAWKINLDNHMDVIEKIKGECDVMKQRERAREEECKELRSKCEASMTDFEKNPTVVAKREKMSTLSTEAKERKANHVSVPHIGNFRGP